ncbi:amino acid adenylation domain-containing protein [Clostridioides difficile]|uniref:amino acid adenylation domain-containing protein n=1 Tax=Clostridioides difficile TaxID=1496 RepID=UPI00038C7480|nr:amino acid adenylation domain-containing protein [Clostridioides difficile]EQI38954.1 gramicidin S synthase 2 [Clostridioides difficile Y184]
MEDFNNNQYEIPYDKSYVDLFREQVKVTPSNIAARDENRKLTYKELDEVTDKLAGYLNHIGVESEDIVAVMLPRDINIIITAIGIMKSGGAFFPIDTSNPEERLNYLLEDSNAKVVITTDELKSKVVNENTIVLDINDEEMFKLGYELTEKITSSNCAYTISTSGSTGRPKTIAIEHKSLVNMCYYSVKSISATENDICGIYLSFSFDAVMKQLFPYLLVGASIDIMPEEAKFDEYTVNEYCEENDITILALPTAFARLFIQNCNNNSLRVVQTGGERLKGYRKRNYELYNEYGPTEFTVVSTSFHVDREYGKIPIGKPIFNTYAYVLDKKNKLCPIGAPGELCLSGIQISRGYLNKKGLTEQVFVENPYKTCEHNKLMYRTGDLVRWLDDGNLDYIGRMDNQVKIDEFRIELYEIENIINNITEIKSVVCISRTNDDGDMYICAYYVIDEEDSGKINERTIREYLNEHLPPYMIPTIIMRIDKIPVTPIGKVNKRALPE